MTHSLDDWNQESITRRAQELPNCTASVIVIHGQAFYFPCSWVDLFFRFAAASTQTFLFFEDSLVLL